MVTRRAFVVGVAALAGCASPQGTEGGTAEPDGTTGTPAGRSPATERTGEADGAAPGDDPSDTGTGGTQRAGTATPAAEGLDLREANVTGVEWAGAPGEDVRFDVTLYHDDEGEDGYANWWQVETLDGDRLGRRELLHAHGTREFTRSSTVAVPGMIACVVIRGHDETHGYGGQAALASLDAGATRLVRQGSEPSSFSGQDCP